MYRRVLTPWLMMLALAAVSVAYARGQEPETGAYQETLTAEEGREALQVAKEFVEGFEARNDLPALIDKLYVKDFDARLRSNLNQYSYLVSVEPEVAEGASREELRRFYAAALGFYYVAHFLYAVEAYKERLTGNKRGEPGIHDLLPASVIDVLRSHPILARMVAEAEEEERRRQSARSGETEQAVDRSLSEADEGRGNEIRSVEELRLYIYTLEKANALTRAHLKTLAVPQSWQEMIRAISAEEERTESPASDVCSYMCPGLNITAQDSPWLPKRTRLIHMKVLAFDMALVRVDGRLRIFNVSIVD